MVETGKKKLKQSAFIATTLDGLIARSNGGIDWLEYEEYHIKGEDYGYEEFIASIDAIVMGRYTFEKVCEFDKWHYTSPVIVLSSGKVNIPNRLVNKVQLMSGTPRSITDKLSEKGYNHLYIDGGKTIQRFLNAGFIQEIRITQIPIILGESISLFGPLDKELMLNHLFTCTYPNGFVQSKYVR